MMSSAVRRGQFEPPHIEVLCRTCTAETTHSRLNRPGKRRTPINEIQVILSQLKGVEGKVVRGCRHLADVSASASRVRVQCIISVAVVSFVGTVEHLPLENMNKRFRGENGEAMSTSSGMPSILNRHGLFGGIPLRIIDQCGSRFRELVSRYL